MIDTLIRLLQSLKPIDWRDGVYHTVSDDEWLLLISEDEDHCSSGPYYNTIVVRYPF